MKYLVCWKEFIAENNMQKKEKDLENIKELVGENKCRSKKTRKFRQVGGKIFQKRRITREIYSKNII